MSITAKELAKKMGLSETAVSMALNNKPGVSTKTRQEVIHLAETYGYDFTKIKKNINLNESIYVISYKTNNTILSYSPIFDELLEGIKTECKKENYKVKIMQFYEKTDMLEDCFSDLRISDCSGIILIGTEIRKDICKQFLSLGYPIILLDTYFDSLDCTSILINNIQGAYFATDYLISLRQNQPGFLQSTYMIPNFDQRFKGYIEAIKENGMSPSRSIIHKLAPSIENAMADMLEIIDRNDPLASSYFAANDIIAIGAIKAFKLRGYKIPEEISIIGFDNISESRIIEPSLTTMDVPRLYIGQTAAKTLIEQMHSKRIYATKIEVSTKMIKRFSHSS